MKQQPPGNGGGIQKNQKMGKKMTLFDLGNEERQIEDALYENGG